MPGFDVKKMDEKLAKNAEARAAASNADAAAAGAVQTKLDAARKAGNADEVKWLEAELEKLNRRIVANQRRDDYGTGLVDSETRFGGVGKGRRTRTRASRTRKGGKRSKRAKRTTRRR